MAIKVDWWWLGSLRWCIFVTKDWQGDEGRISGSFSCLFFRFTLRAFCKVSIPELLVGSDSDKVSCSQGIAFVFFDHCSNIFLQPLSSVSAVSLQQVVLVHKRCWFYLHLQKVHHLGYGAQAMSACIEVSFLLSCLSFSELHSAALCIFILFMKLFLLCCFLHEIK